MKKKERLELPRYQKVLQTCPLSPSFLLQASELTAFVINSMKLRPYTLPPAVALLSAQTDPPLLTGVTTQSM